MLLLRLHHSITTNSSQDFQGSTSGIARCRLFNKPVTERRHPGKEASGPTLEATDACEEYPLPSIITNGNHEMMRHKIEEARRDIANINIPVEQDDIPHESHDEGAGHIFQKK